MLERSSLKLGELNSFSRLVPDTGLFLLMHTSKEAVVSSRIEGTQTQIEEAFANADAVYPEHREDWCRIGLTALQGLFRKPVVSVRDVQNLNGLSPKAAGDLVAAFLERSILMATTGYQRNRSFVFKEYVGMFQ